MEINLIFLLITMLIRSTNLLRCTEIQKLIWKKYTLCNFCIECWNFLLLYSNPYDTHFFPVLKTREERGISLEQAFQSGIRRWFTLIYKQQISKNVIWRLQLGITTSTDPMNSWERSFSILVVGEPKNIS